MSPPSTVARAVGLRLAVLATVAVLAPGSAFAAPPANDARAAAEPLTATLTGRTLAEATLEPGEVHSCSAVTYDATVWFRYTAAVAGRVSVRAATANRIVALFRGGETAGAACGSSTEGLDLRAGEDVLVQVGRLPTATGFNFDLQLSFSPAPPNDARAAPALLTGTDIDQSFGLLAATTEPSEPLSCEGETATETVWFRWVAPAAGAVSLRQLVSSRMVAVYRGTGRYCAPSTRTLSFSRVVPGEALLIQVGRRRGATAYNGRLRIRFSPTPVPVAPANDLSARAQLLSGGSGTTKGTLANAGTERSERRRCSAGARLLRYTRTVWFTFVAPVRGDLKVTVTSPDRVLVGYWRSKESCSASTLTFRGLATGERVGLQLGRQSGAASSGYTLVHRFTADPDQDRDGFDGGGGDCRDDDRRINPDAIDLPADGIDQNCDGADTRDRRQVRIDLQVDLQLVKHGRRLPRAKQPIVGIAGVKVGRLGSGSTVELRCTGRGCRHALQRKVVRGPRTVRFGRPLRRLRGVRDSFKRVTIELTIEYPGAVGQFTRWIVTRDRPESSRINRCTFPGGRVSACL